MLPTDEWGLEQGLRAAETLIADGDHLPVRQLVALLEGGGGCGSGHLILKVQGYVAQFLLDVPDNLTLSCQWDRNMVANLEISTCPTVLQYRFLPESVYSILQPQIHEDN